MPMLGRAGLLLMVCCCYTNALLAQQTKPERIFFGGVGWGYLLVKDAFQSVNTFAGSNFVVSAGVSKRKQNSYSEVTGQYAVGYLYPNLQYDYSFSQRGDISYTYQRRIQLPTQLPLHLTVGGMASSLLTLRERISYGNNAEAYDVFTSLGLAARLQGNFKLFGREFRWSEAFQTPLVSYAIRPPYTLSDPYFTLNTTPKLHDYIHQGRWVGWGTYYRLTNRLALDYLLKNGNGLRLSYSWDYYSYTPAANPVQAAQHTLQASFLLSF